MKFGRVKGALMPIDSLYYAFFFHIGDKDNI